MLTKRERLINVIELFTYLRWNTTLLQSDQFRATTLNKIKEFEGEIAKERAYLRALQRNRRSNINNTITTAELVGLFSHLETLLNQLKTMIE